MGVVASYTDVELSEVCDRFATMSSFINIIQDFFMTVCALIRSKEIVQRHINIFGIWMVLFIGDVGVTVLAGYLTVNRDVESFCINQPGSFNPVGWAKQK